MHSGLQYGPAVFGVVEKAEAVRSPRRGSLDSSLEDGMQKTDYSSHHLFCKPFTLCIEVKQIGLVFN